MMSRLRCCLYILMAKRYAVFTANEGKTKLASQCKEAGEQILEEVEK